MNSWYLGFPTFHRIPQLQDHQYHSYIHVILWQAVGLHDAARHKISCMLLWESNRRVRVSQPLERLSISNPSTSILYKFDNVFK